jgi:hypothetical protein
MAEVSRIVANRQSVARTVVSSIEHHAAPLVPAVQEVFTRAGAGGRIDVGRLFHAAGAVLESSTKRMVDADLALAAERSDDDPERQRREKAVSQLRETVIDIRGLLSSTYGDGVAREYGLDGATPDDHDLLINYAVNAANLMKSKPIGHQPKRGRPTCDAAALAGVIEADVTLLSDALDSVKREEREEQGRLVKRDAEMNEWSRVYSSIAGLTSALFKLGGNDELAERIRPTERKSSGTVYEEQSGESPAAESQGIAPQPGIAPA